MYGLSGLWFRATSEMLAHAVSRSPRIKQLIGVVTRAALWTALLLPWLAILAWLYLQAPW